VRALLLAHALTLAQAVAVVLAVWAGDGCFFRVVRPCVHIFSIMLQPVLYANAEAISVLAPADDALLDFRSLLQTDKELDDLEPMIAADIEAIQRLKELACKVRGWVVWIYAYRALARTVDSESDARKQDSLAQYAQTRLVIEPVIFELRELLQFTTATRTAIVREVQMLLEMRKTDAWWNDDRLWALVQLLDELLILDSLKDPKSVRT
jgi:hypothetical protein